ncbi:uncharacterized protein LOC111034103 [Myzus persicae]|uniref:uncharacterized protein LOC111034103 n=1 Tax=Myzus persicae TaxID=13164 RepID=UPI000B9387C5|nr:uncharacterized protein LOC111034103 [Myzus persicae]
MACSKNFDNKEVLVFLDAAHMVKLVRNAFCERKQLMDKNRMIIDFDYIKKLFILQEQEGCHLANKHRKQHIFFFKQKMKVKLATQLLGQSVADALKFYKLKSIKLYKLSQDHLELFFGNIRAQNGYNNNPTARQFRSAYRKLVINVNNVQLTNSRNCIPLESIDILHYSSSDPIKGINESTTNINSNPTYLEDNLKAAESFINDHEYIVTQNTFEFSNFTKEIIIYISKFVVHKLASTLQCETCVKSLYAINKDQFLNSLIFFKNRGGFKGGLVYPSDDVIIVCLQTEKTLKYFNYQTKAINKLKIQSQQRN